MTEKSLVLDWKALQQLDELLQEMPIKYGSLHSRIISFLHGFIVDDRPSIKEEPKDSLEP